MVELAPPRLQSGGWLSHAFGSKWHKCHVTGAFHSLGYHSLMFGTVARVSSGSDLPSVRDIALHQVNLFVIDRIDLISTELAVPGAAAESAAT